MQEQKENFNQISDTDSINIREELDKYLIHWKWFLVAIILSFVCAFLYIRYTTPQ